MRTQYTVNVTVTKSNKFLPYSDRSDHKNNFFGYYWWFWLPKLVSNGGSFKKKEVVDVSIQWLCFSVRTLFIPAISPEEMCMRKLGMNEKSYGWNKCKTKVKDNKVEIIGTYWKRSFVKIGREWILDENAPCNREHVHGVRRWVVPPYFHAK